MGVICIIAGVILLCFTLTSCVERKDVPEKPVVYKTYVIQLDFINGMTKVIQYRAPVGTKFEIVYNEGQMRFQRADTFYDPIKVGVVDFEILNP